MLWRAANSLTRPFQSCRISCRGRVQSIPAGGPTTLRSNFRNKTSKLRRSVLYIVRCPAAKTATGEITASKYRSLFPSDTFLSHNVAQWQKNAFANSGNGNHQIFRCIYVNPTNGSYCKGYNMALAVKLPISLRQTILQTCLPPFSAGIRAIHVHHLNLRKRIGAYRNWSTQSSGWKQTKPRMNVVWSLSYFTLLLRTCGPPVFASWTIFWEMVKSHVLGAKRCSKCYQKRNNPKSQQIFGPSQTSASCTKFLHTWFLDALKHRWNTVSLRNNMGSEATVGLKNIYWLPIWWLTKHC